MTQTELFKQIISDFQERSFPDIKPRNIVLPKGSRKIISLIGARRSGKTYILFQEILDLIANGIRKSDIIYINFEDERLNLTIDELDLILQAVRELDPSRDLQSCYFFFDEIQNVEGWEKFIRRIHESICSNIFITGSNAHYLSREIATSLRGRTISYEVFPLSFSEYCGFLGISTSGSDSKTTAIVKNALQKYLLWGGFPETVSVDEAIKIKILQEYFNVMMYHDLIERYQYKSISVLKYFIKRLFASSTKQVSINKIYNELKSAGIRTSKDTLYEYFEATENVYIIQKLQRYKSTPVNREFGERKVYPIDPGLLNTITFKFSSDFGKLLELTVFLELLRRNLDLYYYRETVECDFLIQDCDKITQAVQVCANLSSLDTRKREINGLLKAAQVFELNEGLIISMDEEEVLDIDNCRITIMPLYKWLLSE